MISTFYSLDALGTPAALLLAGLIGFAFGYVLEQAGFSSSRRLSGVFYFTDMAVVKVMFTALVVGMLGLSYLAACGWLPLERIFLMPTIYGAQIVGGLLFGVGFVMGGWCPGTAAAGLAAGRGDALVFLVGALGGSLLFNEAFPLLRGLYTAGDRGVQVAYATLGVPRNVFVFGFTLAAVGAFWLCEWVERLRTGRSAYLRSAFLPLFCVVLVAAAAGLFALPAVPTPPAIPVAAAPPAAPGTASAENALLETVDQARDHIEPEELADRLLAGEPGLVVVDVRPAAEFAAFHIRGALNLSLPQLAETLQPYRNTGLIVLYSNGMTHPAQARDSLQRQGFDNVYLLTDGLQGFRERCLMPVSLRPEPLTPAAAARVNAWRATFDPAATPAAAAVSPTSPAAAPPRLLETDGLASQLGTPGLKLIDLRPQPEYNTAHVPGALSLNVESLRGNVGGVPSMLLPPALLAAQFSLLGLQPSDSIVFISGDKLHDTTLAGLACERLGHLNYAVLNGGYPKWASEGRPADAALPAVTATVYPVPLSADRFSADYLAVRAVLGNADTVIIDVRPPDYFTGKKSDEARAGHIPGALNRPFTEDVVTGADKVVTLKPLADLAAAYSALIPSQNSEVIVHCRTGHQASQTAFVLRHLLGYTHVRWYDAGWTEWAAHPELPLVNEAGEKKAP
jgi:thiosulfate/3-mercaptopyruvate sulfurtransferase